MHIIRKFLLRLTAAPSTDAVVADINRKVEQLRRLSARKFVEGDDIGALIDKLEAQQDAAYAEAERADQLAERLIAQVR